VPVPAQSRSGTVTSGNPSVTFTSNLASGGKILAAICVSNSSGGIEPVTAVKDGAGNNLTKLKSVVLTGALFVELWGCDTPAGDVGTKPTITATVSTNFGVTLLLQEVPGLLAGNTTAMLDGSAAQNNGTASPATAGSYSSTAAGEYLIGIYGDPGDGVTVSNASGYTADPSNVNANSFATLFVDYKNSTNGAELASWTMSGSATDGWETILVAFKLAAVGGSPSLPPQPPRRTASRTPGLPPARRYRQMLPVPAQLNPPYPFAELSQHRETWPRAMPHRGRQVTPVPAQVNPLCPFAEVRQQRQPRGFFARRGRAVTPVPSQLAAPVGVFVPQAQHRARVAVPPRRGRVTTAAPGQLEPPRLRQPARRIQVQPRRSKLTAPVHGQHEPPRQGHARRLVLPVLRHQHLVTVPQQAPAPVAPAQLQPHRAPARALFLVRRVAHQLMPWAVSAPPPFSVGTLTAATQPMSVLTEGETSSALTAGTTGTGTLTAGISRTGGPG